MEDVSEIIIVILGIAASLISAVIGKAKQSAKNKKTAQQQARSVPQAAAPVHEAQQTAIWNTPAAPTYAPAKMSGEGVDDCHEYMLKEEPAPMIVDERTDEEREQMAKELVRGFVLSEILNRPKAGYGRRGA